MEYAIGYVAIIFVLQAIAAIRTPREDCQVVIFATVFWPLMIVLVGGSFFLDAISWNFDLVRNTKLVGFRRSPNPEIRGWAVTLLTFEFQLFAVKKA